MAFWAKAGPASKAADKKTDMFNADRLIRRKLFMRNKVMLGGIAQPLRQRQLRFDG
jgi:hypothetical protein